MHTKYLLTASEIRRSEAARSSPEVARSVSAANHIANCGDPTFLKMMSVRTKRSDNGASTCTSGRPDRTASTPRSTAPATATVLRVVDGDTVDVLDDARGRLRVRVLGIDTPETKRPGYTEACWGREATEFATSTLLNRRVALIADASQDAHDRYGRTYLH